MPSQSLREFLQEQARVRPDYEERQKRVEEWRGAVQRLIDQLRTWLQEADPDGVLALHSGEISKSETRLGQYKAPFLVVRLFDEEVKIVPVARNVVGYVETAEGPTRAEGRVDLLGRDGISKYILYRVPGQEGERWYLLDDRFKASPLDQGRFEAALKDLLS